VQSERAARLLELLGLSEDEQDQIFYRNAAKIFGLEQ